MNDINTLNIIYIVDNISIMYVLLSNIEYPGLRKATLDQAYIVQYRISWSQKIYVAPGLYRPIWNILVSEKLRWTRLISSNMEYPALRKATLDQAYIVQYGISWSQKSYIGPGLYRPI